MDNIKRLYQEFFIAFALGAVPIFIAYWSGGADLLGLSVKALVPPDNVIWYFLTLSFLYCIVSLFDRFVWKKTEQMKARLSFWRSTWAEVGTALHSLWRLLAGFCFAVPVLWGCYEPETIQLSKVFYFTAMGVALLAQCWCLSLIRCYLEGRVSQLIRPAHSASTWS